MLVLRLIRCLHNESICHCVTSKKDTFIFIILFFSNNFGLRAHTAEMKRGTIPDVSLIGLSTSCLSMFVGDGRGSVFNDIHVSAREEGKPKFVFFKKSLRSEQNKKTRTTTNKRDTNTSYFMDIPAAVPMVYVFPDPV